MADRPNVVLVVTDTQGLNAVGDLGGAGEGVVDTPTLDRLADEGVSCANAYAGAPVCGPSRGCMFTGHYAHNAGSWTNNVMLYQGIDTMGTAFREAGYRTAYVGKWHLDGDYHGYGTAPDPYEQEYWYDGENYRQDVGDDFFEWYWPGGFQQDNAEYPPETLREQGITREDVWGGRIVDRARAFIEDVDDDQPYFLVVSYDEPHEPSLCPPEYAERYVDDLPALPENYETLEELTDKPDHHRRRAEAFRNGEFFIDSLSNPASGVIPRPVYFGCAEWVDSEIGRLLETVDDHDRANTVVSFTSDHGHHLGAHGLDSKWATAYEETVNVPLVFRYPDGLPAGELRESVASHVDLRSTLVDLAGLDADLDVDGRTMRPLLEDGEAYRDAAMIEYHGFSKGRSGDDGFLPLRALVTERDKLVVNLLETDEFYDLEEDPGEVTNRIDDPAVAERRDARFDELTNVLDETADPFYGGHWDDRHWN
jgi:uncharacterized sulfatase